MTAEHDQRRLLDELRAGDARAFARLIREHLTALRRFAAGFLGSASEGDDVAQRILLDLWTERASLEVRGGLRAHLLVRARHECLERSRGRRRAERWAAELARERRSEPPSPLEAVVSREHAEAQRDLADRVRERIDALDEDARTSIWMRFGAGASFDEIGSAIGRPAHAARALVYRELGKLRGVLERGPR